MERADRIKRDIMNSPVVLCPERAYLVTDYFKNHDDPSEPQCVRKAKAFRYILSQKKPVIFRGELIVGNAGTSRVSCILQPELASVFMMEDLLWLERRKTTPMVIPWRDKLRLITRVIPYWLFRNLGWRAFPDHRGRTAFIMEQLHATYYILNEAGGIGHFLPNYEKMINLGIQGYLDSISGKDEDIYRAARIACEGLEVLAKKLALHAEEMAVAEHDLERSAELSEIARICRKVPLHPAETFHEALQSLWLTHLGVNLESLNSAVSFGRVDQYLYPFYENDLAEGRVTPERAKELIRCFSAKATEHVFLLSERISQYHGGYLVVQAAIVGGMDREGKDAVNPLTYLFLDVMEEHGMRDPNYQARIHEGSPDEYLDRVFDVARKGNGVPAVFNDEAAIPSLVAHGFPLEDARDYGVVGCVELSIPGKSFLSTDAGLFNIPLCLEFALNSGRRFAKRGRVGARTPDPSSFSSMDDVIVAFRAQLEFMVSRMVDHFHIIEKGNRDYHPTPLSSLLVDGCMETGRDLTEGGAIYNSSGIQGVGVADVADSLAAIDLKVFKEGKLTMARVVGALKDDFAGHPRIHAELKSAPKFGNDDPLPDSYADIVIHMFHEALTRHRNTRGGTYVPGYYSVTCHVAFGRNTGALPSGRKASEAFAPSIGPCGGADFKGPTALLNSVSSLDSTLMPNGNALNLRFDPMTLEGDRGIQVLKALSRGFFAEKGMEMQFNVLDPDMMENARANPGKYPGLVVRVAGYCAYFDDLPDSAKREIIARTRLEA